MNLVDTIDLLGLDADLAMEGRWVRIGGERCSVYVVELARGRGYFTWCDDPVERAVEFHEESLEANLSGLRRAARHRADGQPGVMAAPLLFERRGRPTISLHGLPLVAAYSKIRGGAKDEFGQPGEQEFRHLRGPQRAPVEPGAGRDAGRRRER